MTQNRTPLGLGAACLALTSTLLLAACGSETITDSVAGPGNPAEGATGPNAAPNAGASDPTGANPVADLDVRAQDAGTPAPTQDTGTGGGARPVKFSPPPARRVPGAGAVNTYAAPNNADSGLADSGQPLSGTRPNPGQPAIQPADLSKLKAQYTAAGLSEDEIAQKLDAYAAGPTKTPMGPAVPVDPNAKLAVEFGSESHDFGRARQGDQLTHTFELQSGGSAPLKIRQVSPTCGCTVGKVKIEDESGEMQEYTMGDSIDPGRRVTVDATLNTSSKRNNTQVRINVYHNDPVGLTTLSLAANIEPFLTVTPAFLNFGDVKQGQARNQTIDVRTARGEPLALRVDDSRPIPMPNGLEIDLVPVNPNEDGRASHWQARVTLGEDALEGNLGFQLLMVTDVELPAAETKPGVPAPAGPVFHKANASISARILGALSHNPQFLSMGLVRPGQVVPRTVKILSHDEEFDLSQATVELRGEQGAELVYAEHFTTSLKPTAGANGIDVELRLTGLPEGSDGSFRGELVVLTGHPDKPEISVRFSGVCRAGVK